MRLAAALVILTACSYSYHRLPITVQTKNPSCRAVRPAIDTAAAVSLGTAGGLVGLYGLRTAAAARRGARRGAHVRAATPRHVLARGDLCRRDPVDVVLMGDIEIKHCLMYVRRELGATSA